MLNRLLSSCMRERRGGAPFSPVSGAPSAGSVSMIDESSASAWERSGRKGPRKILCWRKARMGLRTCGRKYGRMEDGEGEKAERGSAPLQGWARVEKEGGRRTSRLWMLPR